MLIFFRVIILASLLNISLYGDIDNDQRDKLNFSLVISGGVSLGAYEAGYNWAIIKMLSQIKTNKRLREPSLRSVTGASAGSINALLSVMY